ncbi:MAG: LysR family transcriptional regulator [Holosporales bacterium]|jgi:DNA-binding transcriptional LysR family regulator|nr:LysR family transcriptional regulator [Holosporales bacterium]
MIEKLKHFLRFADGGLSALEITRERFLTHMAILEGKFKHKLIKEVEGLGIVLTEFGRSTVPYANQIVTTFYEIINMAHKRSAHDLNNQVTIGLVHDSASTWAMNCMKDFNKMHPGLRIILFANNRLTNAMLERAHIIFWSVERIPVEYNALWYIEFKYGLYASNKYIGQCGMPTLETIHNHSIIAYSGRDNNAEMSNWHLYGAYGLPLLKPTILSQSRDLIVKMTSDGLGIGAISDRQDAYYKYEHLIRVIGTVSGPTLKSYFLVRSGLNEQMHCNIMLLDKLFRNYFSSKGVKAIDVCSKNA